MNRRKFHRSLFRLLVSFCSFSLFCSLFVFYGNIHVINDLNDTRDYHAGLPRRNPKEAKFDESKSYRHTGFHSKRAFKSSARDKRRALQGFFELKNGSTEFGVSELETRQPNGYFGCSEIRGTQIIGQLGHGYTKSVQKGLIKGTEVAVKSVLESNKDVQRCLNSGVNYTRAECYNLIKYKLAKEIILLQQLQHTNIISVRLYKQRDRF
jgi:hypothetical protein